MCARFQNDQEDLASPNLRILIECLAGLVYDYIPMKLILDQVHGYGFFSVGKAEYLILKVLHLLITLHLQRGMINIFIYEAVFIHFSNMHVSAGESGQ